MWPKFAAFDVTGLSSRCAGLEAVRIALLRLFGWLNGFAAARRSICPAQRPPDHVRRDMQLEMSGRVNATA
ncbi:hypothetical protein TARUN_6784 [Trichoderma arundinaceum]|uniref:Uncharacterized protein n=1 Tax=Trichoderma arundinaceum TaxID=490622 RepID=A0A395NHQ9_TRIAR|nr:hypothetical protein TARUN_6784 [Trichoderma arundinaceum]